VSHWCPARVKFLTHFKNVALRRQLPGSFLTQSQLGKCFFQVQPFRNSRGCSRHSPRGLELATDFGIVQGLKGMQNARVTESKKLSPRIQGEVWEARKCMAGLESLTAVSP
jgi:hypothetical protein